MLRVNVLRSAMTLEPGKGLVTVMLSGMVRKDMSKMDTTKLKVGERVYVDGGFGPIEGRVAQIAPQCIYVSTEEGQFRFNSDGKECAWNGSACTYEFNVMVGPGPRELKLVDEVEFERNVTNWLLEFLKAGEKPADEILKNAEKKFGRNVGDQLYRASKTLVVEEKEENHRWYWSLRWEMDENNVVLRPASKP
jgi:hypothetical protein